MTDAKSGRSAERWWTRLPVPRLPRLPVAVAAAVSGVLCGVVATALVWGGEQGCDAARGRPSCGGYGYLMLAGIVVVCFVLGVLVLRWFEVERAAATAFFGLAIPMLVILVFLMDDVFDTWMAFAVPAIVGCCFVLSVYLARALEAANPSPYADDTAAAPARERDPADGP